MLQLFDETDGVGIVTALIDRREELWVLDDSVSLLTKYIKVHILRSMEISARVHSRAAAQIEGAILQNPMFEELESTSKVPQFLVDHTINDAPVREDEIQVCLSKGQGKRHLTFGNVDNWVVVKEFARMPNGDQGPAESCNEIIVGDLLIAINGAPLTLRRCKEIVDLIATCTEPDVRLRMFRPRRKHIHGDEKYEGFDEVCDVEVQMQKHGHSLGMDQSRGFKELTRHEVIEIITKLIKAEGLPEQYSRVVRRQAIQTGIHALLFLQLLAFIPKAMEEIVAPAFMDTSCLDVCFSCVKGELYKDPQVIISALRVLRALVLPPAYICHLQLSTVTRKIHARVQAQLSQASDRTDRHSEMAIAQTRARQAVMEGDYLCSCIDMLQTSRYVHLTDNIRYLTVQILLGLSLDPSICGIFQKMNLTLCVMEVKSTTEGSMNRFYHDMFDAYSAFFIGRLSTNTPSSQFANETEITFDQTELLVLIRNHLASLGLTHTAQALTSEAGLRAGETTGPGFRTPHEMLGSWQNPTPKRTQSELTRGEDLTPQCKRTKQTSTPTCSRSPHQFSNTPSCPPSSNHIHTHKPTYTLPFETHTPISLTLTQRKMKPNLRNGKYYAPASARKQIHTQTMRTPSYFSSPVPNHDITPNPNAQIKNQNPKPSKRTRTLQSLVTIFLRQQHSTCKYPLSVLPTLSLTQTHACPIPKQPVANVVSLMGLREYQSFTAVPYKDAISKFLLSRFRLARHWPNIRACAFSHVPGRMYVGTRSGQMFSLVYNRFDGDSYIHTIDQSVFGMTMSPLASTPLLTTSHLDCVMLWDVSQEHQFNLRIQIDDLSDPVFDCMGQKLFGLKFRPGQAPIAACFDLQTGASEQSFHGDLSGNLSPFSDPNVALPPNQDHLLLALGNLWDTRAKTLIHRYNRVSESAGGYGFFNHNGHDIIMDGMVWDIRTHTLVHVLDELQTCRVTVSGCGRVIYAYMRPTMPSRQPFVRAFDGRNYAPLGELANSDVYGNTHVAHVTTCPIDNQHIALVQGMSVMTTGPYDSVLEVEECSLKMFEMGRHDPCVAESVDGSETLMDDEDEEWTRADDEITETNDDDSDADTPSYQSDSSNDLDAHDY